MASNLTAISSSLIAMASNLLYDLYVQNEIRLVRSRIYVQHIVCSHDLPRDLQNVQSAQRPFWMRFMRCVVKPAILFPQLRNSAGQFSVGY